MKNLKEYISEGIFDIEDNIDKIDKDIEKQINEFLYNNFTNYLNCKISKKPNKDGKFEVSVNGNIEVKNKSIISLTNGLFIWTNIKGDFICSNCNSLTSLEGAPKEVKGSFYCNYCNSLISLKGTLGKVGRGVYCDYCDSLTSLEGAPKEVGGDFICVGCNSLTSLEGAPKKVGGYFYCNFCDSLTSLEGAPKKVGLDFSCKHCNSLTSLEGAPKEVGGDFLCPRCGIKFTTDDVKKVSNVKGNINV